jgi:AcrR family transcriptional regulator
MLQGERSERSRGQILEAALELFSHRGYGATSVRDVAEAAGLSKGNVYHHFPDKESIFRALLDQFFERMARPDLPFNRAIAAGTFPDNLEEMGRSARGAVEQYRPYVALMYADMVEFEGAHTRKFYEEMTQRSELALAAAGAGEEVRQRLAGGLSPVAAVMLAARIFFDYFSVEILLGVRDPDGRSGDEAVREIARILRHGMLRDEPSPQRSPAPKRKGRKR